MGGFRKGALSPNDRPEESSDDITRCVVIAITIEVESSEQEQLEQERLEQERLEQERRKQERRERERRRRERRKQERHEQERREQERREQERKNLIKARRDALVHLLNAVYTAVRCPHNPGRWSPVLDGRREVPESPNRSANRIANPIARRWGGQRTRMDEA